ncbi:JAB domain-containing protein [Paenibacillus sp. IHB B 3415]|uniref:JAB domain-containing protein n=1 Tax=Paenibacillus sp. IHB B 3415 TaxID=867080 RepID=UPI000699C46B|nr:JAB domain-containing protein [Paenibacillus sp. IHB B 3415]
MNNTVNEELMNLISQTLNEQKNCSSIQQLIEKFPTTSELMDVSEQQLVSIKGIGKGKARQITAMLKLAKVLTLPDQNQHIIRNPKDVFNLLESELRYEQKEHFICLFLNTKNLGMSFK